MRVRYLAGVLGWIVILAPAARTRADGPSVPAVAGTDQRPRLSATPAGDALAPSGVASTRAEHRKGMLAATRGGRSGAIFRRGAANAVMATAIENAAHGPGAEPPLWGDPSGIDVRAAASVIHAWVAPGHAPARRRPRR